MSELDIKESMSELGKPMQMGTVTFGPLTHVYPGVGGTYVPPVSDTSTPCACEGHHYVSAVDVTGMPCTVFCTKCADTRRLEIP